MEARELRIGNYILREGVEKPIQVVVIDVTETNFFTKCKPIPLTEEILSKNCNFKRYKGWDDQHYWSLEKEHDNSNRFELFETDNGFELLSGAKCDFVHQLQNCYYFHYLKEELEINL